MRAADSQSALANLLAPLGFAAPTGDFSRDVAVVITTKDASDDASVDSLVFGKTRSQEKPGWGVIQAGTQIYSDGQLKPRNPGYFVSVVLIPRSIYAGLEF